MKLLTTSTGIICLVITYSLFGCSGNDNEATRSHPAHEVRCQEPLPLFTLGPNSKPTQSQERQLCSCIWSNLGTWEKKAAEAISKGKEGELSYIEQRGFPSRFGEAFRKCGGMGL